MIWFLCGWSCKKVFHWALNIVLQFPHHNLTVEAASPGLFIDQHGTYWDVPFTMAVDLASVASDAGPSYHICINQNTGPPKKFEGHQNSEEAANILPSLSAKSAFSYKKNIDIWRSKAPKMKLVQPYDVFLSNPHISASGILGKTYIRLPNSTFARSKQPRCAFSVT